MLVDGISLIEGSDISNLVVNSGSSFPSLPDIGELFYKTSATAGLYVYDGSGWAQAGSAEAGGTSGQLQVNSSGALAGIGNMSINGSVLTVGAIDTVFEITAPGTNAGGQTAAAILLRAGTYNQTSSIGGAVTIQGGTHAGLGGTGGTATLLGGVGVYTGGNAVVQGGTGAGESYTSNPGGNVLVQGGLGTGTGSGGYISFSTAVSTTHTERLRIESTGGWRVGGTVGASGEVLTSNGPGTAPTWQPTGAASVLESNIVDGSILARVAGNEMISGTWTFNNAVAGATPTVDTHLATKAYVDSVASGLDPKASVRAATTGNIVLSGTQTVDGVSLVAGDRVLVKNQSTASANGIYVVASGTWTRAADADNSPVGEVTSGMYTLVTSGTLNGGTGFTLVTPDPITLGSTALTFTQFSAASQSVNANDLVGTTLAPTVVTSSLTTIGTLGSLNVTGAASVGTLTATGSTVILGTSGTATTVRTPNGAVSTNAMTITVGDNTAGIPGLLNLQGGTSTQSSGTGGDIQLRGGTGGGGGSTTGGALLLRGGLGTAAGGYVAITTAGTTTDVERLRFLNNGAWSVGSNGTSTGSVGQVLSSNGSGAAPTWSAPLASALAGTTLAANVVGSSLTSVGTLNSLTVSGSTTLGTALTESRTAITATATTTLNCALGNIFAVDLATSITSLVFTNVPASGRVYAATVLFTQGTGGNKTITWPGTIQWTGDSPPVLATTAGKTDVVTVVTQDGGTTWIGMAADSSTSLGANDLSGTTLASNVVSSSLTSVGTLSSLTVSGNVTASTAPTLNSHLVNKLYVDTISQGLHVHAATQAIQATNVTATYDNGTAGVGATLTFASAPATVDGYTLVYSTTEASASRIMVTGQTNGAHNGVYYARVAGASGVWMRATDMDEAVEADGGDFIFNQFGSTYANTGWVQTTQIATMGTTAFAFQQFSGAGTYLGGTGMTITGNTFNVNTADAGRIVVNADNIDLATVGSPVTNSLRKITTDAYGRVSATSAVVEADLSSIMDNRYVNTTGDTMTGTLFISASNPTFILNAAAAGESANIFFGTNNSYRWRVGKDTSAESGANAGSNLFLFSYADDGATASTRMTINRATGAVAFPSAAVSAADFTALSDAQPLRSQLLSTAGYGGVRVANQVGTRIVELISLGSTAASVYGMSAGEAGINTTVGTNLNFSAGDTLRMQVSHSTGNVAIGGSAGSNRLDVFHAVNGIGARLRHTGTTVELALRTDATTAGLDAGNATGGMAFSINTVERMRLDTSGNLGVGYNSSLAGVNAGGSVTAGAVLARAQLTAHQTNAAVLQYSVADNVAMIRAYGATSGTGGIAFNIAGGGGSPDTEGMRLNSAGNLGLGTQSPTSNGNIFKNIDIRGTAGGGGFLYAGDSAAKVRFGYAGAIGGGVLGTTVAEPLIFQADSTERMRILSTGQVLVARTTNSGLGTSFQVAGSAEVAGTNSSGGLGSGEQTLWLRNTVATAGARGGGIRWDMGSYTSGAAQLDMVNTGSANDAYLSFSTRSGGTIAERMIINGSGITVTGTVTETSTIRVKENVRDLEGSLSKVLALRGVKYDMKDGSALNQIGLIAEEVHEVVPNVVYRDEDGEIAGVQYARLVAVLIEGMKEQEARIKMLEAKLAKLVD